MIAYGPMILCVKENLAVVQTQHKA